LRGSWLVVRRARDLGLLARDGVLDVPALAYGAAMRDELRVSSLLEATHAGGGSAVTARLHDSVIVHPVTAIAAPGTTLAGEEGSLGDGSPVVTSPKVH
jgi:hypothetical protein